MAMRRMEITLISARDLNNTRMFSKTKTKAFAVAWISNNHKGRQWTPVDMDNGINPAWNHVMNFIINEADLQQGRLLLEIAIFNNAIFGHKEIGRVSIPLNDFLQPAGSKRGGRATAEFVSYQVRKPSGKPKGVLNLCVILGEKADFKQQQPPPRKAATGSYRATKAGPVTSYPAALYGVAKPEPVTAYPVYSPAGSSSNLPTNYQYPPPPYPPRAVYPPPPPYYQGYPPSPYQGYPSYQGYPPYQGYPQIVPEVRQPCRRNNKRGMGMGKGLIGGAIGGLLLGLLL